MRRAANVLLVEDSAGDALLTGQTLAEALRPVNLTIARDGIQALMMLANPSFDPVLIILDLNLPALSGFDVLERNPRRDIPVVVFSASMNKADVDRAFEQGAVEYIQKPMDLRAYKEAVLAMIDLWAFKGTEANQAGTDPDTEP
jgi:CheY-like chemotaxis protein